MTLVEREQPRNPSFPLIFDPYEEISRRARPHWSRPLTIGYMTVLIFFGGFGGFAALAPLHSAVMAIGEVKVDNDRRIVQHPEGGIVTEIDVREGQTVKEGDVLLRLDPTRDKAQANILHKRYISALAERARLIAERDALDHVEFPKAVMAEIGDPEIKEIVDGQRAVFTSRQDARDGQVKLILGQIDQAKIQIGAVKQQRESVQEQLRLIEQELNSVRELYEKGLERLPRLLALQRNEASLKGEVGRLNGSIAQNEKQIGELELRVVQIERDLQREIATQLDAITGQIQSLTEQEPVISASVRRLEIRAPRSGKIIDLRVHTIGQVIAGREQIMQIVPNDEALVVVGKVKARDIDSVNAGVEKVQVRITAFSQRFMHPILAHLESVSGDIIEGDGPPYYRVIVRLDPESEQHVLQGQILTSGMPATIMLGVGEKTLLTYLIEPLSRSITDSLREP